MLAILSIDPPHPHPLFVYGDHQQRFHYYVALLFEFFPQGTSHHRQRIMSQKKTSPPPEKPSSSSSPASGRHKRPCFRNVVLEVMKYAKFNKYVEPILEPLVRRVVCENFFFSHLVLILFLWMVLGSYMV